MSKKETEDNAIGCLDIQSSIQRLKEHLPILGNYLNYHYHALPEKSDELKKTLTVHFEKMSSFFKTQMQKSFESLEIELGVGVRSLMDHATETMVETEMTVFSDNTSNREDEEKQPCQEAFHPHTTMPDMDLEQDMSQGFLVTSSPERYKNDHDDIASNMATGSASTESDMEDFEWDKSCSEIDSESEQSQTNLKSFVVL